MNTNQQSTNHFIKLVFFVCALVAAVIIDLYMTPHLDAHISESGVDRYIMYLEGLMSIGVFSHATYHGIQSVYDKLTTGQSSHKSLGILPLCCGIGFSMLLLVVFIKILPVTIPLINSALQKDVK